jgi:hypothetical protein
VERLPRHGLELAQLLERGGAQTLVAAHAQALVGGLAVGVEAGRLDRHDFALEVASVPGAARELLAAQAEAVGVFARDAPGLPHELCPGELGGELIVVQVARGQRRAALHGGSERDPAHHLDAAGQHHVLEARAHEARAERGGLLARAALGVEGAGGHLLRKAAREPGRARQVEGLLAHLRDAAPYHLAHRRRVDAGAHEGRLLHDPEELTRVQRREPASALSDRAAHRLDDVDRSHAASSRPGP